MRNFDYDDMNYSNTEFFAYSSSYDEFITTGNKEVSLNDYPEIKKSLKTRKWPDNIDIMTLSEFSYPLEISYKVKKIERFFDGYTYEDLLIPMMNPKDLYIYLKDGPVNFIKYYHNDTPNISESVIKHSIKKVLKEEFSFIQLQDALDNVKKIIKNFDTIDCDDYSNEEYVNVYCNHYGDVSLDDMYKIKDAIDSKLKSVMYREFKSKSSWMR